MLVTSDLPALFILSVAVVFGALWGSFFNVAIYRWPREMSVVTPPSHCPACGAPIPAWRNVPIFGYFMLRGRAACCGARLSPRYVVVELLGAAIATALAAKYIVHAPEGTSLASAAGEALVYFAFGGGLLIATFVDLEHMEIPDEVSLPGAALGLATAGLRADPGAESAALGAGGGFLAVQLIFVWSYERLTGRRGMGEGDSKLLMMIGAFLGWRGALFALVAGAFQGLIAALVNYFAGGKEESESVSVSEPESESVSESVSVSEPESESEPEPESESEADADGGALKIPFGPFLALGALEFLFFGEKLLALYARAAGF
ncbi:MAG: prepilin peptidase [Sandaracinaceae bacterium]|nr:prepilin peptidase [Sandaracinaceae bacterium]